MARKSGGGTLGKLVLLGVGALIGAAMTQKKVESNGKETSSQSAGMRDSMKKGIDTLNQQTNGMVDKMKPQISKALDKAKEVIEKQQQMMEKEKGMLDQADKAVQESTDSNTSSSPASSNSTKHEPSGHSVNNGQPSSLHAETSETPRSSSLDRADEHK